MSVGLVMTELVLNAAKYAYGGEPGPVEVDVEGRPGRLHLRVRDYGSTTERPQWTGFGFRLISSLVERLQGELRRTDGTPGYSVAIDVPLPEQGSYRRDPLS